MALTDEEIKRTRYHLGYPNERADQTVSFGLLLSIETSFLVDAATALPISTAAEDRVRKIIATMDRLEDLMANAAEDFEAYRVESITLRLDVTDQLEREYRRWGHRLAELLGVPVYPYAERYKGPITMGGVHNVGVRH